MRRRHRGSLYPRRLRCQPLNPCAQQDGTIPRSGGRKFKRVSIDEDFLRPGILPGLRVFGSPDEGTLDANVKNLPPGLTKRDKGGHSVYCLPTISAKATSRRSTSSTVL